MIILFLVWFFAFCYIVFRATSSNQLLPYTKGLFITVGLIPVLNVLLAVRMFYCEELDSQRGEVS